MLVSNFGTRSPISGEWEKIYYIDPNTQLVSISSTTKRLNGEVKLCRIWSQSIKTGKIPLSIYPGVLTIQPLHCLCEYNNIEKHLEKNQGSIDSVPDIFLSKLLTAEFHSVETSERKVSKRFILLLFLLQITQKEQNSALSWNSLNKL